MRDQKRDIGIVLAIAFLFVMAFTAIASASVTVSFPNPAVISLNPSNPSQVVEFENQNLSQNPTVDISIPASLNNIIQVSASTINVPSHASVTFSIKSTAPAGSYSGNIDYNYGSGTGTIPVSVFIQGTTQQNTSTS